MNDIRQQRGPIVGGSAPLFERFSRADVRSLVEAYPLAWVCAGSGGGIEASLLPLVGVYDENGRLIELIGHLMRSNPLHALMTAAPSATILFQGPDAYVSPEHAGRRDWAPTWNYAQLRVTAEVHFSHDDAGTEHALQVLVEAMEAHRANPWVIDGLGPRYREMLDRIIGFRARVEGVRGKFKLGQDEAKDTLRAIMDRLPDPDTVHWMRRFNEGR